ncbi:MAG: peptidase M15, partial [Xanthobacteraceae bacterium]
PTPPPETRVPLASLFTSDPVKELPKLAVRPVETPNECLVAEICIDEYLWSLYERTPKFDTIKVPERIKVTVKKKGKLRTVIKTITKYVVGDFTWKDPIAAKRAGMSLMDYVIGGMDRGFKLKLYRALRVMDEAGLMPGITSAFRDDYRQSIASGNKAASDSSYHGGSRRGGYGHGLAADLVSVKGETRMQRYASSEELWKWIDAHEKELGVGRPYLDRDPPHVGPIDGREYAVKRGGRAHVQKAGLQTKHAQKARLETKKRRLAARNDPGVAKRAKPQKSSKVSSLQNRASVQR